MAAIAGLSDDTSLSGASWASSDQGDEVRRREITSAPVSRVLGGVTIHFLVKRSRELPISEADRVHLIALASPLMGLVRGQGPEGEMAHWRKGDLLIPNPFERPIAVDGTRVFVLLDLCLGMGKEKKCTGALAFEGERISFIARTVWKNIDDRMRTQLLAKNERRAARMRQRGKDSERHLRQGEREINCRERQALVDLPLQKLCHGKGVVPVLGSAQFVSKEGDLTTEAFFPFYSHTFRALMSDAQIRLTNAEKIDLARQIIRGLQTVHGNRVAHNDLHAGNLLVHVFIDESGKRQFIVGITDFGGGVHAPGKAGMMADIKKLEWFLGRLFGVGGDPALAPYQRLRLQIVNAMGGGRLATIDEVAAEFDGLFSLEKAQTEDKERECPK